MCAAAPFAFPVPTALRPRLTGVVTVQANDEIYAQGEPIRRLYRLVRGVVRTARVNADGRRQVGDFYHPGELFGYEPGEEHRFSAEALTDCAVELIGRMSPWGAAAPDVVSDAMTPVSPLMLEVARQELRKASDHLMLLGRKSAREKVALFLMGFAGRGAGGEVELPMGRQDIADYLGLTVETVSRMLTQLQGEAVIELPSVRRVQVKRWDVLRELAA